MCFKKKHGKQIGTALTGIGNVLGTLTGVKPLVDEIRGKNKVKLPDVETSNAPQEVDAGVARRRASQRSRARSGGINATDTAATSTTSGALRPANVQTATGGFRF